MTGTAGFAVLGLAGFASLISPSLYKAYPWIWIPIVLVILFEVGALVYFGAKTSTTFNLIAGLVEVAFLLGTGVALVALNASKVTYTPFTTIPLGKDWPIILTTMIFAITTYGGMNQTIPLAEEAEEPKRNVPKALLWLALLIGIPLIFNAYAQEIAFGVNKMF